MNPILSTFTQVSNQLAAYNRFLTLLGMILINKQKSFVLRMSKNLTIMGRWKKKEKKRLLRDFLMSSVYVIEIGDIQNFIFRS